MTIIKRSLSGILIISMLLAPMSYASPAAQYSEITGPKTFFIQTPERTSIATIDCETVVHLPKSVKTVFVEEYQPRADGLEKEVRAYTIQQTVYWILATVILVYTRMHT